MDPQKAEQMARLLDQIQDAFAFLAVAMMPQNQGRTVSDIMDAKKSHNSYGAVVFGFSALALVFAYDGIAKDLNYPADITAEIDIATLGVTQNDLIKRDGGNLQLACFRHLRNCFAHSGFTYHVAGNTTTIALTDHQVDGTVSFQASCEAQDVATIAEKVLIKAQAAAIKQIP